MGALLNTIRPEFLFSFIDYNQYVKSIPEDKWICDLKYMKILKSKRFQYISLQSWLHLYYQILKIFYISRINWATFPKIPGYDGKI
jgi:hypothetical protein